MLYARLRGPQRKTHLMAVMRSVGGVLTSLWFVLFSFLLAWTRSPTAPVGSMSVRSRSTQAVR